MIGVDTNLVVRILTNDDPEQTRRAAALFTRGPVLLPVTVVLESEWVLRYAYGLGRDAIASGFRKIFGLPQVSTESPAILAQALAWYDSGLDFADALHLATARCQGAEGFATFDEALLRKAGAVSEMDMITP